MKHCAPLGRVLLALSVAVVGTATPLVCASCPADIDGDGIVGDGDEELILAVLGPVDPEDAARSRADLNGNGYVCDADLDTLYDNWGPCPACPADLNDDGVVNEADRQALEDAFGRLCRSNLGRFGDVGEFDLDILLLSSLSPGGDPHPDADPRADLNADSVIDSADEQILMNALETDCRPDLSSDGHIDADDLWLLLGSWGPCSAGPAEPLVQSGDFDGRPPKQCDPKGR